MTIKLWHYENPAQDPLTSRRTLDEDGVTLVRVDAERLKRECAKVLLEEGRVDLASQVALGRDTAGFSRTRIEGVPQ